MGHATIHGSKIFLEPWRTDYVGETGSLLVPLGRSKNDPGRELYIELFDKIVYPVRKRTKTGPEIVFFYFFEFQRLVL